MQLIARDMGGLDLGGMALHCLQTGNWPAYAHLAAHGYNRWANRGGESGAFDSDVDLHMSLYKQREEFIRGYGYAIPCIEALDVLAANGPWVEIGAGSGFWSAAIRSVGGDCVATDLHGNLNNPYGIAQDFGVVRMDAAAAVAAHPDKNVLAVWPCYKKPWCHNAIKALKPGRLFALVSEGQGGCVGTDSLFRFLDKAFRQDHEQILPQFPGLHDRLEIFVRK